MQCSSRTLSCLLLFSSFVLCTSNGRANNIQVSTASLTGNTGTSIQIQFNLSWENSWRGGGVANWDAAWVFAKYRTSPTGAWQHVRLNNTGHVAPTGSQIDPGLLSPGSPFSLSNPVLGAFVYRSANGNGTFAPTGVQLQWNYAGQGLSFNDLAQVRVYAIEMVYIPTGSFAAGSGGAETNAFTLTTITSSTATATPTGTGTLGGQGGGYPTGQTPPVNASWPNGYANFYMMKYELSQQGYVDALNAMTYDQQVTLTANAPSSVAGTGAMVTGNTQRSGIDIQTPGVASGIPAVYACNLDGDATYGEATDGKEIACNWMTWGHMIAYLDWSGLRPMTELEFEKACRGTIAPTPNEYVWGTLGVASSAYTLSNAGAANEGIATNYNTTLGNAAYTTTVPTAGAIGGPVRVGVFAANAGSTGRVTAGAGYYGVMDLGGNLWERAIYLGNVDGRSYTGTHGDGVLTATGRADVNTWPPYDDVDGEGLRGGAWNFPAFGLCTSDRSQMAAGSSLPGDPFGARGVRTAP